MSSNKTLCVVEHNGNFIVGIPGISIALNIGGNGNLGSAHIGNGDGLSLTGYRLVL